MRIEAKCGCGATVILASSSADSFAEGRVTKAFDEWNKLHAACPKGAPPSIWPMIPPPSVIPNGGWPDGTIICGDETHK